MRPQRTALVENEQLAGGKIPQHYNKKSKNLQISSDSFIMLFTKISVLSISCQASYQNEKISHSSTEARANPEVSGDP
jgi:hypothetical protein